MKPFLNLHNKEMVIFSHFGNLARPHFLHKPVTESDNNLFNSSTKTDSKYTQGTSFPAECFETNSCRFNHTESALVKRMHTLQEIKV